MAQIYKVGIAVAGVCAIFIGLFLYTISGSAQEYERTGRVHLSHVEGGAATPYASSRFIALTPEEPPTLRVSYYTEHAGFDSAAIKNLSLEVYTITPEEALEALSYSLSSEGGYAYQNVVQKSFVPGKSKHLTTITKKNVDPEEDILLPVEGTGMWFVRAIVNDQYYDDLIVHSSRIASVAKETSDELLVWTQNILSGERVSGGEATLYSLKDDPHALALGTVNTDGIVMLPLRKDGDVVLVRGAHGDVALVPLNIPEFEYEYEYDRSFTPYLPSLKYYLFTDRPLYTPGDTVRYKAIVRTDTDAVYTVPHGSVEVRITHGWGPQTEVYKKVHTTDAFGTIAGEFTLPDVAESGGYTIEVVDVSASKERWLGAVSYFSVERYRKPEYTLDSSILETQVRAGEPVTFSVTGEYFFGQPLAHGEVSVAVSAHPFHYYGPLSSEYIKMQLSDADWWQSGSFDRTYTLNESGRASITFDTNELLTPTYNYTSGDPYILTFTAHFVDESGNPAQTSSNVLVWPSDVWIEEQDSYHNAQVHTPHTFSFTIRSHSGVSTAGVPVTIEGKRRWWEAHERHVSDASTLWRSRTYYEYTEQEETIPHVRISADANGKAMYSFTPSKPGYYEFVVNASDVSGRVARRTLSLWVYEEGTILYDGDANYSPYHLSIKADKTGTYRKDETALLTLGSVLSNRDVLLTVERGSVRRYEVVRIGGRTHTMPFTFDVHDIPNIFVTISGFGPYGFGGDTINLPLATDEKEIAVSVVTDMEEYAPGAPVRVTVETKRLSDNTPVSADVALWAVDKALYALASDTREPIKNFFWRERYNETNTAHSLQGIVSYGGAEKGCFAEGTEILLTDGGTKQIEKMRVGDIVKTRNEAGEFVDATVSAVHTHTVSGYLIINGRLRVTPEHVVWVNGAWNEAGDIQVGDTLLEKDGTYRTVTSLEWQQGLFKVYNLTIEREHTFIADGVWVHNDKGGDVREIFSDVAYWNPHVITGYDGRAVVTFTLPHNLTTWVMSGVAANASTEVGERQTEFVVTKPLIVRPVLPNFVRTGDTVAVATLIHNFTGTTQDVVTQCAFTSAVSDERSQSVTDGNFAHLIASPLRFTEPTSALYRCDARAVVTGETDAIALPFPVLQYGFLEHSGSVAFGSRDYVVNIPQDSINDRSLLTLTVSPSVYGTLPVAMRYLIDYPYGCVEQTTSRFVPAIIAKENERIFKAYLTHVDLDTVITDGIKRLIELKGDGQGWSWWMNRETDPLVTSYVVEYLMRARALGYEVPQSIFDGVLQYARALDPEYTRSDTLSKVEITIARSYLLALLGEHTNAVPLVLSPDLGPDFVALGLIANARHGFPVEKDRQVLLGLGESSGEGLLWKKGNKALFGSSDASTAYALRALILSGDRTSAERALKTLSHTRESVYWTNTFATAQTIDALALFARTYVSDMVRTDTEYRVMIDGKEFTRGTITNPLDVQEIIIPHSLIASSSQVITIETPSQVLYSALSLNNFRTDIGLPASERGLTVYRTYEGAFTPGEVISVTLTVVGETLEGEALVIEDHLPGGLIPINVALKNERDSEGSSGDNYFEEEFTQDGVVAAIRYWDGGTARYTYRARVVSRGEFMAPPAHASLMYRPEISGHSQTHGVRVSDDVTHAGVFFDSDTDHVAPYWQSVGGKNVSYGGAEQSEFTYPSFVTVKTFVFALIVLCVGFLILRRPFWEYAVSRAHDHETPHTS